MNNFVSRKCDIKTINWANLQFLYNNVKSWKKVYLETNLSRKIIDYGRKSGFLKDIKRECSSKTKQLLSKKRKEFLQQNPQQHVWKRNSKFISNPCEYLKIKLKENNITFLSEVSPLKTRNFSIDIVIPEWNLAIEVNGNQHYLTNGKLKPYYLERHNLIESETGLKLLEIPYNYVYKSDIIDKIKNFENYSILWKPYIKKEIQNFCIDCGCKLKAKDSKRCPLCNSKFLGLKTKCPEKSQLENDLKNFSKSEISRKYNVSFTTVKRWINKLQLDTILINE